MREYTPEYQTFREDAIAILNGAAIVVAVAGFWSKPIFMGPVALAIAVIGYFLSPRSKGGTIIAVIVITMLAVLGRWIAGYSVA
ncbi:MAG: hypothetical protein QOH74_405 [Gaiellales bacterium]|nr:hypothetical protein [Gaiellales bacterium]